MVRLEIPTKKTPPVGPESGTRAWTSVLLLEVAELLAVGEEFAGLIRWRCFPHRV